MEEITQKERAIFLVGVTAGIALERNYGDSIDTAKILAYATTSWGVSDKLDNDINDIWIREWVLLFAGFGNRPN